jgi:hypothetical protein
VPGTCQVRTGLLLAVAADVLCDLFLERLQAREQLARRDRLVGLPRSDEPRSCLDRNFPRGLVGLAVLPIGLLEWLDPVEVDVRESVPLLLVEFDPRARLPSAATACRAMFSLNVVYSAPSWSRSTNRVFPDLVS